MMNLANNQGLSQMFSLHDWSLALIFSLQMLLLCIDYPIYRQYYNNYWICVWYHNNFGSFVKDDILDRE